MADRRRASERALEIARQQRRATELANRYPATTEHRAALSTLLALTGKDWSLLLRDGWPAPGTGSDAVLIGPPGIFAVTIAEPSTAAEGSTDQLDTLRAATSQLVDHLRELRIATIAVSALLVTAANRPAEIRRAVRVVGLDKLHTDLLGRPARLSPTLTRLTAEHLAGSLTGYSRIDLDLSPASGSGFSDQGLFAAEDVIRAQLESAQAGPIENWMTVLPQDQYKLHTQHWNGPARISGPAGTGKTVVGLHRAAYLARRTTGKILFLTFVRNLPRVQEQLLSRMAPDLAGRIEFSSLHSWALRLLQERSVPVNLRNRKQGLFGLAWSRAGRHSTLGEIEIDSDYWADEIEYVIKGRGITGLPAYLALDRPGRRTPLRRNHRELVWHLYETYTGLQREKKVHDFADLIQLALDTVRARPADPAYGAVIVDEVQDLSLTGIQLVHALTGDGPNRLLLIGDGQQSVYPGGFRLSDAGLNIQGGRAKVLRVNYRNASAILEAALEIMSGESFEDLDGTVTTGRPDVELSYQDGQVLRATADTQHEHDRLLMDQLATRVPADTAILCANRNDVQHYLGLLSTHGIPSINLEKYEGHQVDAVKVGTYHRAKGLEFKAVLIPRHDQALRDAGRGGLADPDRLALAKRQLYVGMTRARDLLWLGSLTPATPPPAAPTASGNEPARDTPPPASPVPAAPIPAAPPENRKPAPAEDRCLHDMLPGQCASCRHTAQGLPRQVIVSEGGQVFHSRTLCQGLLDGQRSVARRGGTPGELERISPDDALARGLGYCVMCWHNRKPAGG